VSIVTVFLKGVYMRFNQIALAAAVLGGSILLAACGGDSSSPAPEAVTSATVNASTGPALIKEVLSNKFSFQSGIADFGTTSPTTLELTGDQTAPKFALVSGLDHAEGSMKYGSCIFTIDTSTYVAPHRLAKYTPAQPLTIEACKLSTLTKSIGAGVSTAKSYLEWALGSSLGVSTDKVTVDISSTGVITIHGTSFGTIKIIASGASGGAN
jgi:hypothetical protein